MTDSSQIKAEIQALKMNMERIPRSLKENWTTSVIHDELALLEILTTGRRRIIDNNMETETQRQFQNPNLRSIQHLKHIERNLYGRYAYTPKQNPPRGAIPTFNATAYPEVIPRFHLPKMPF